MKVGFHSVPDDFLKTKPPYSNSELHKLVQKAASLGFKYFQVGPLSDFLHIDGKGLRDVLESYGIERNVHVGGLYDARKFAMTEEEYERAQQEIHRGIELCLELSSALVSFHPPFFRARETEDEALLLKARTRFIKLVEEEAEHASDNGIRVALESFCYRPFIFKGLHDFVQFVSHFPSTRLGVLLEVGHLYQAKFSLDKAVHTFADRLLDVHVHDATLHEDYAKATHLPIGRGTIDFPRLITTLREVKYDEWLTLEIHGNERNIVQSKQYLESLITAEGRYETDT
jgi:sugar phosphate isomerase/epimerase